jgi:hypothetical protein
MIYDMKLMLFPASKLQSPQGRERGSATQNHTVSAHSDTEGACLQREAVLAPRSAHSGSMRYADMACAGGFVIAAAPAAPGWHTAVTHAATQAPRQHFQDSVLYICSLLAVHVEYRLLDKIQKQ